MNLVEHWGTKPTILTFFLFPIISFRSLTVDGKAFDGWFLSNTKTQYYCFELSSRLNASLVYFLNNALESFPLLSNKSWWLILGFLIFSWFMTYSLQVSEDTNSTCIYSLLSSLLKLIDFPLEGMVRGTKMIILLLKFFSIAICDRSDWNL